ncbi:MAG TPA: NADPH-dependent 7-cyano-7-deazaguanine reductase QueF [Pseudomonadales bacterium]
MKENPLGKAVAYPEHYDPGLLVPLAREDNRQKLGIDSAALPFTGADIWNAYELSWLDTKGMPQVARGRFIFPCTSPFLVESKSLKLYLNSLNQHAFADAGAAAACIRADLSQAAGAEVEVLVQAFGGMKEMLDAPDGIRLDANELGCDRYDVDASLLQLAQWQAVGEGGQGGGGRTDELADEVLYTDLFRSRCPMTGQPDWATVTVCYKGPLIDHAALLRYFVSYRLHADYHENCVERIYCDLMARCKPQSLSVEANFLRRGGLDINPVRASAAMMDYVAFPRYNRQ